MSILGIDYGKKRIGVAISLYGKLAKPLGVYSRKNFDKELSTLLKSQKVEKAVIGITNGKLQKEIEAFARLIEKQYGLKTILEDETMTSFWAQKDLIQTGTKKKKRKKQLDAYAASLILEKYLEIQ